MRLPQLAGRLGVLGMFGATAAFAVPLSPEELAQVCAPAEGTAHCGRLVEELQLKRLPNLARRAGPILEVSLYPTGNVSFTDTEASNGGRSYSLWDFISEINTVVIYATDGDDASFTLLQRATGRKAELPSDPKLSPDRARLVTADFCTRQCTNELAVWRVSRDGIRKELAWTPKEPWQDAVASWLDADVVAIEYTAKGASAPAKLLRRLAEPGWTRTPAP
jgi:hypothetical protein